MKSLRTGPRFLSSSDPELSQEEVNMRKYGKGKNISMIGYRKKNKGWLKENNTEHFQDTTSSSQHMSPFSFGFDTISS